MVFDEASVQSWKRLAASKMCGYALAKLGRDSDLIRWLDATEDSEWVEACLSPFVSTVVLDANCKWNEAFAIEQTILLLSEPKSHFVPWSHAPSQLVEVLQGMGTGSRRQTCDGARIILPGHPKWERWSRLTGNAIELIKLVDAPSGRIFHEVCAALLVVDDLASFRGASGSAQRGLIFLSPEDDWDEVTFAEEMVHEATHCTLDLVTICTPLFSDPSAYIEEHKGPFRPDPRHLYGNYHAVVVATRCIQFYEHLRAALPLHKDRANTRIATLRAQCREAYQSLLKSPTSKVGGEILNVSSENAHFL